MKFQVNLTVKCDEIPILNISKKISKNFKIIHSYVFSFVILQVFTYFVFYNCIIFIVLI